MFVMDSKIPQALQLSGFMMVLFLIIQNTAKYITHNLQLPVQSILQYLAFLSKQNWNICSNGTCFEYLLPNFTILLALFLICHSGWMLVNVNQPVEPISSLVLIVWLVCQCRGSLTKSSWQKSFLLMYAMYTWACYHNNLLQDE